jgi:WD40 repeat protein
LGVITNGKLAGRILEAHENPIHKILHLDSGNIIATGDDDGVIRIWDLR